MGSPLYTARFAFDADVPHSSELDLSAFRVRGVLSPEGHALGAITIETRRLPTDVDAVHVGIDLVDADEAGTLLVIDRDLPLMWTILEVDNPRGEAFELFLVYDHRG